MVPFPTIVLGGELPQTRRIAASPPPPGRAEAALSGAIPVLLAADFVAMLSTLACGPLLPLVAEEIGTSVALVGQVPATMMLLVVLLGLVTVRWLTAVASDRSS